MSLFNINKLISTRQWFHKHAELSLKEFNTQKRIKQELLNLGIKESEIKVKANTGLQIDLKGVGPTIKKPKIICLRADIDALPIKENNDKIGKKNKNNIYISFDH
jgi:metal-dependent amidase/aminoacylase/carboxypeptidase family protein